MAETSSTRAAQRAASVRTALTMAVVALVLFGGIILAQRFGPSIIGLAALAAAVAGFALATMRGRGRAR